MLGLHCFAGPCASLTFARAAKSQHTFGRRRAEEAELVFQVYDDWLAIVVHTHNRDICITAIMKLKQELSLDNFQFTYEILQILGPHVEVSFSEPLSAKDPLE